MRICVVYIYIYMCGVYISIHLISPPISHHPIDPGWPVTLRGHVRLHSLSRCHRHHGPPIEHAGGRFAQLVDTARCQAVGQLLC